jgi:cell wall-associated NlpC family hydrolase
MIALQQFIIYKPYKKKTMNNPILTPPLLATLLIFARNEIGVKEVPPGSNRGPRVEEYLHSVRLSFGYAWCNAFVYWCFEQASSQLNRVNPLPRTGSCLDHWNKTRGEKITSQQVLADPTFIQPGDIFILDRHHGLGHTGIVVGVSDHLIHTIEGNANSFHSGEGDGVIELQRDLSSINVGFIRYT